MKAILLELAKGGKITRTSSPYAAACMVVPKKDDPLSGVKQWRLVIDFRPTNAITITSEVPIPNIQHLLEQLQGAKYFTLMDMDSGFFQIRIAPEDQHKTGFRTPYGHFEFKVMPKGLKGAPGTFQTVMMSALMDHVDVRCAIYLDDVVVYSPDLPTHIKDVELVLKALQESGIFPKASKCNFCKQRIEYLGHSVGADGIRPSDSKIADLAAWPEELKEVAHVRQFLGTMGYVRMFMGARFSDLSKPLLDLTKKGVEFKWTQEHTEAVRALKKRLVEYTQLQLPDQSKPYELETDASDYALGAVLKQEDRPLGFLSKKMNEAQQKYSTYQKEFLAIITALKKWEHLLRPATVKVFTDHSSLQHILNLKSSAMPRGMVARWMELWQSPA